VYRVAAARQVRWASFDAARMSGSAAGVWGQNLPLYIAELQFRYDARFNAGHFRTTIDHLRDSNEKASHESD
jgi:hypothetical protein